MKFSLGQVVMTAGIANFVNEIGINGELELSRLIGRHVNGDWGDVSEDDKVMNDEAVKDGDRIMSSYKLNGETIWVVTEWDRSVTTVLFPDEY